MKRILLCFLLVFEVMSGVAQDTVFVLVDVSKSIRRLQLEESKAAIADILKGNAPRYFSVSGQANLSKYAMRSNDVLHILPFGNKETVMNRTSTGSFIANPASDIDGAIGDFYPVTPTDDWTYITLARARVAQMASNNRIKNYKLIFVSDNISDNFNGNPNYSQTESDLVSNYNTTSNQVSEGPADVFRNNRYASYEIRIQEIDIKDYTPNPTTQVQPPPPPPTPEIKINPPLGDHQLENCYQIDGSVLHVGWSCKGAPAGAKYLVVITAADGGDYIARKQTMKTLHDMELPDGKYQVSVKSATPEFSATQDSTYVEIRTGSYSWLIVVLALLAAAGGAYWYLEKKRTPAAKKKGENIPKSDPFAAGGGSANNNEPGGYF